MSEESTTVEEPTEEETTPEGDEKKVTSDNDGTVPKSRLDAEIARNKKLKDENAAFKKKQQEEKDEAARAAGDIKTAQQERDGFKSKAERATAYVEKRLENIQDKITPAGLKTLEALPDDVDPFTRLEIAELHLAQGEAKESDEDTEAESKEAESKGTKGGKSGSTGSGSGIIPADVLDLGQYHTWFSNLSLSRDPKERAQLSNPKWLEQLAAEKSKRFGGG